MSGPFDVPQPSPSSDAHDPFGQSREELWTRHEHDGVKTHNSLFQRLSKPESLAGEGLLAAGLVGSVLMKGVLGRRLAFGAMAIGAIITGISSVLETEKLQK